jgi:hypothetical protein
MIKTIEQTHIKNKYLVEKHNLKEGDFLYNKKQDIVEKINHIHPIYYWVVTDKGILRQDLENIHEYIKLDIEKEKKILIELTKTQISALIGYLDELADTMYSSEENPELTELQCKFHTFIQNNKEE